MIFNMIVIGAGGTGSYFLKEFARFVASSHKIDKTKIFVTVVDGDRVEEKNLERQNFFSDSLNQYKAEEMVSLIIETFDVTNFVACNEYILSEENIQDIYTKTYDIFGLDRRSKEGIVPVIIGCVDNHQARTSMEHFFKSTPNCVYYDSANEFSSGEVVFSYKNGAQIVSPVRSHYFPDMSENIGKSVVEMSCSELNSVAPQHLATNMKAANILLTGLLRFIVEHVAMPGIVFFDTFRFVETYEPYVSADLSVMKI